MTEDRGRLEHMRKIADEAIEQQGRVCGINMQRIEEKVDELVKQVERLTGIVDNLKMSSVIQTRVAEQVGELARTIEELKESSIVQTQKWKLFTIVGSVLAFVVTVVEVIRAIEHIL